MIGVTCGTTLQAPLTAFRFPRASAVSTVKNAAHAKVESLTHMKEPDGGREGVI